VSIHHQHNGTTNLSAVNSFLLIQFLFLVVNLLFLIVSLSLLSWSTTLEVFQIGIGNLQSMGDLHIKHEEKRNYSEINRKEKKMVMVFTYQLSVGRQTSIGLLKTNNFFNRLIKWNSFNVLCNTSNKIKINLR